MRSRMMTLLACALALGLGGCGILGKGGDSKPKTPTIGNRIPVLTSETGAEVDPSIADVAVVVPPMQANSEWGQSGGNASKSVGHVALGETLTIAWSTNVRGADVYERLGAAPVIGDGRIYTVDTHATLRAHNAQTGALVWEARVGDPKDTKIGYDMIWGEPKGNTGALFGGGAAYDNGRVYATNGLGDVSAFEAATGKQLWKTRPGGPLRGSPGIGYGSVFVISQDNQIYALNQETGEQEWTRSGTLESAGIFGVASPAIGQGTVIAGYSSGELSGYRYENGQEVWQDALARTSISVAVATISDIDADPVIDQGRVFAIGQGGRMVSLDILTGQRLWEVNIAGIATPWVAGEWIFVVTDEAKLLCISRVSGKVRWQSQLRRYTDQKSKKGLVTWTGPVLAGNRLVVASSLGDILFASPADGSTISQTKIRNAVRLPPIVANNMLYVLDNGGRITAWK